jgi:hypothetical protein
MELMLWKHVKKKKTHEEREAQNIHNIFIPTALIPHIK